MPVSGPGSKIPGVKDGETPVPTSFKKLRAGDRVVVLLKGSQAAVASGSARAKVWARYRCQLQAITSKMQRPVPSGNNSKGDMDFISEDVIGTWVTSEAKTSTPGQRIAARAAPSRKQKVEEDDEDQDEDEDEDEEENEDEKEEEE